MIRFLFYLFLLLIVATGCKVARPVQVPEKVRVPDTLWTPADSSIADLPWKQFFTDPLLQQLIDTALQNNPDVLIALQRMETARASLLSARGAMVPLVNAVASAGVDNYGDYTMNGVGNYDTNLSPNISKNQRIPDPLVPDYFLGLRSSWEADIWGKLKNRKQAAIARLAASAEGQRLVTTMLVAQTAGWYYQLLALDNESRIIQKNIQLQEAALEVVRAQKEGGRATELAVQQMEAQVYNTRSFAFRVKQEIVQAENQLNFLLGRFAQAIRRDSVFLQKPVPQQVMAGLSSQVLLRRPDIREAEWQLVAAKADVQAARAAFLPSFQLNPYVGLNAFKASLLFNGPSLAFGVLGSLTAPLFNQKQLQSAYQVSVAQNKEVYYQYRKTILNSFREINTSLQQLENTGEMFVLKQKQVTALQQAVASSQDLYVAGYASYLEVITAQKGVLDAELELNETQKNRFLYLIDVYRELGGGWK